MDSMESNSRRIMLTVAYDGTDYHGWQYQDNGKTIESELNKALSTLLNEEIMVIGASRTDAGVHALCNIAVFDTKASIPAGKFAYALNQMLPSDIRVRKSEEVAVDFHPRKVKTRKTYEYHIDCEEFPNPIKQRYSHFTYTPLNVSLMQQAANDLIGQHDFTSFCSVNSTALSPVRMITDILVTQNGCDIVISVTGNGFLYNMVRIIAGTLVKVGCGQMKSDDISDILMNCDRTVAGPTAPPQGLTLVGIEYPNEKREQ